MKLLNKIQLRPMFRAAIVFLFLMVTFQVFSVGPVQAQTQDWSDTINLSSSGSASNPAVVAEADGTLHVLWRDEFSGIMHTQGDQNGWTKPDMVAYALDNVTLQLINKLPDLLSSRMILLDTPILHSDQNGLVHAFWQTDDLQLFYNRVQITDIAERQQWSQASLISDAVISFNYFEDNEGNLHLVFVTKAIEGDDPAGVYYQRWSARTQNWTEAEPLFESLYFRKLTSESIHVGISGEQAGDESFLYIVWDDVARLKTYFTRSTDNGVTWEVPVTLASPEGFTDPPVKVQVIASGSQVLVLWQEGDNSQIGCAQRFILSEDAGQSWAGAINLFENNIICPEILTQLASPESRPILFVILQNQPYLVAWNGSSWGELQRLSGLVNLYDPETRQPIQIGCQSATWAENRLFFVGCDQDSGDIWGRWWDISDVGVLISERSNWEKPIQITSADAGSITQPVLVADLDNKFHAFWLQQSEILDEEGASLFYARLQDERWTNPISLFTGVDQSLPMPFNVKATADGRFVVTWRSNIAGEIYFSWASASRAYLKSEWIDPVMVAKDPFSLSPDVIHNPQGELLITYVVSINEARGVYKVASVDNGKIWSTPELIFDGIDSGWDIVGPSSLVQAKNGDFVLLVQRYTSLFDLSETSLYYGQTFGGETAFTFMEELSIDEQVNANVPWGKILINSLRSYHRFWLDHPTGANQRLWHQFSVDQGQEWSTPVSITISSDTIEALDTIVDPAGNPHLVMVSTLPSQNEWQLRHWLLVNNQWQGSDVVRTTSNRINAVSTAFTAEGQLGVIFSEDNVSAFVAPQDALWFSQVQLDVVDEPVLPVDTTSNLELEREADSEQVAETETSDDTEAQSTVLNDDAGTKSGLDFLGIDARILGPLAGGIVALVIILVAFFVSRYKAKKHGGKYF